MWPISVQLCQGSGGASGVEGAWSGEGPDPAGPERGPRISRPQSTDSTLNFPPPEDLVLCIQFSSCSNSMPSKPTPPSCGLWRKLNIMGSFLGGEIGCYSWKSQVLVLSCWGEAACYLFIPLFLYSLTFIVSPVCLAQFQALRT